MEGNAQDDCTTTVNLEMWSEPNIVEVIEGNSSIELIYIERALFSYTSLNSFLDERVFKIIFSCKDGKWHKSERIYGEIVPAQKEYYKF